MLLLKKVYEIWKKFAYLVGKINSTIVLSFLFFALIGPYALIRKIYLIFGDNHSPKNTFWIRKERRAPSLAGLGKQF